MKKIALIFSIVLIYLSGMSQDIKSVHDNRYLKCQDYYGHERSREYPDFSLFTKQSEGIDEYFFALLDDQGNVILISESYPNDGARMVGVRSVDINRNKPERWIEKEGKRYLRAGNYRVIGKYCQDEIPSDPIPVRLKPWSQLESGYQMGDAYIRGFAGIKYNKLRVGLTVNYVEESICDRNTLFISDFIGFHIGNNKLRPNIEVYNVFRSLIIDKDEYLLAAGVLYDLGGFDLKLNYGIGDDRNGLIFGVSYVF